MMIGSNARLMNNQHFNPFIKLCNQIEVHVYACVGGCFFVYR